MNDIARAGFAGKEVSIAYYYKFPAAEIGGGAEVSFVRAELIPVLKGG